MKEYAKTLRVSINEVKQILADHFEDKSANGDIYICDVDVYENEAIVYYGENKNIPF